MGTGCSPRGCRDYASAGGVSGVGEPRSRYRCSRACRLHSSKCRPQSSSDPDPRERSRSRDLPCRRVAPLCVRRPAERLRSPYMLQRPDIIISDIGLPGEDGYALLQQIRSLEQEHGDTRMPALTLTAFAREEDHHRAVEAGYDAHLAKPVDPDRLLERIAQRAERARLRAASITANSVWR
jgi:CheY-like chemotaxis protein